MATQPATPAAIQKLGLERMNCCIPSEPAANVDNRASSQLPPTTHQSQPFKPQLAAAAANESCCRRAIQAAPASQVTTLTDASIKRRDA